MPVQRSPSDPSAATPGRWDVLRQLGPGIAIAATGVGAGDLVAASLSGKEYGYAVAWAALVGALGWRATFAATGGVLIVATAIFARIRIVEPPISPGSAPSAQDAGSVSRAALAAFAILCVTGTLGGFAYRANTTAQPALFAEAVSFMGYGAAASLAMCVGIAGQYLGGIVADARELRASYLFFHVASLPMLLLVSRLDELPLVTASSLYVFFALGMQPIENSIFATLTPERWRSTAYGMKFVLTFGVGSISVWMVRFVAGTHGWGAVYVCLAGVVTLLIALIGLLIWTTRRQPLHNH